MPDKRCEWIYKGGEHGGTVRQVPNGNRGGRPLSLCAAHAAHYLRCWISIRREEADDRANGEDHS